MSTRSSALNSRLFDLFTPTATTTSSNREAARETMSTCPLVTGSKDPGHAARRTRTPLLVACSGGVTVPKRGLAVAPGPVPHQPLGPHRLGAAAGPLHDHESGRGEPPAAHQRREVGVHRRVRQGVRRGWGNPDGPRPPAPPGPAAPP